MLFMPDTPPLDDRKLVGNCFYFGFLSLDANNVGQR